MRLSVLAPPSTRASTPCSTHPPLHPPSIPPSTSPPLPTQPPPLMSFSVHKKLILVVLFATLGAREPRRRQGFRCSIAAAAPPAAASSSGGGNSSSFAAPAAAAGSSGGGNSSGVAASAIADEQSGIAGAELCGQNKHVYLLCEDATRYRMQRAMWGNVEEFVANPSCSLPTD